MRLYGEERAPNGYFEYLPTKSHQLRTLVRTPDAARLSIIG